jgi:protein subunit release factor B
MDLEELKKECDITTFRSSGPGGQHKNVTDSAVRLRHRSTGIIVIGRRHRSQRRNLQDALERLAEKLKERRLRFQRKRRIRTRKSRSVRERELVEKRKRGEIKALRKKIRRNNPGT